MQEQQYRQPSGPLSQEQVAQLQAEEQKRALREAFPGWSLEHLERLLALLRGKDFKLYLAYLALTEQHLTKEVWKVNKDDRQTTFLRGQKHQIEAERRLVDELDRIITLRKETQ